MKTLRLTILATILAVFAISCVGPRGYDGRDGQDGEDGTANVGVAIYDVQANEWTGDVDGYTASLIVPEITEYVYQNGAVLIYMLKDEGTDVQSFSQLPYTWLNSGNTEYMDYNAFIGRIDITIRWVDNGINTTEAPDGKYSFKVIVIEGTPLAVLKQETDLSNPELVLDYLSGKQLF